MGLKPFIIAAPSRACDHAFHLVADSFGQSHMEAAMTAQDLTEYEHPHFVIDEDPMVEWPVVVDLPMAGGTFAKFQFNALICVLSPAEYEALFADSRTVDRAVEGEEKKVVQLPVMSEVMTENVARFAKLIRGWSGIKDAQGNEVAFSRERLTAQILGPRGPALSVGFHRAIGEVRFGTRFKGEDVRGAEVKN